MKKRVGIFWLSFLILMSILIFIFYLIFSNPLDNLGESEACVDVNLVSSFIYDVCYDAYSKELFLSVKRTKDSYDVQKISISFFDLKERVYPIFDVPLPESSKAFKIHAEKNPLNLTIRLDIIKDFSSPICDTPRLVSVKYCSSNLSREGIDLVVSPIGGTKIEDFIPLDFSSFSERVSDALSKDLVEKEMLWSSVCESSWTCDPWEKCIDGVQKRSCWDSNNCVIPTNAPEGNRYCDERCEEMWVCEWSSCFEGFTTPSCVDKNSCGTKFDIPSKLPCGRSRDCVPNFVCGDWSSCNVDYNLYNLIEGNVSSLKGIKQRVCQDINSCVSPIKENSSCSLSLDVYTKIFRRCGIDYLGVYNRLDDSLIARIEGGDGEEFFLNVVLDEKEESSYCDYCFDGVLNGDELGIDCGGNCMSCEEKYPAVNFKKKTFFDNFVSWLKRMIT